MKQKIINVGSNTTQAICMELNVMKANNDKSHQQEKPTRIRSRQAAFRGAKPRASDIVQSDNKYKNSANKTRENRQQSYSNDGVRRRFF